MENNKIYWAKVNKDAIIPTKRSEDAGYDLYPCFEQETIVIAPNEVVFISTGVACAFNQGSMLKIYERGSTGSRCMSVRAGVVDSGFRNEIVVMINNTSNLSIVISSSSYVLENSYNCIVYPKNKAIAQAVLVKLDESESEEISYEDLLEIKSERGISMLGDSGK